MKCKFCGKTVAADARFCPECGSKIEGASRNERQKNRPAPPAKKSNVGMMIAICVTLLSFIAIVGIFAFLVLQKPKEKVAQIPDDAVIAQKMEVPTTEEVVDTEASTASTQEAKQEKAKSDQSAKNTSAGKKGDYVIPDSSSRYLKSSDVSGLSSNQLRLARNEIYARHGRKFNDEELQDYFNGKNWYKGTILPDDFVDERMLSKMERENIKLIQSYE